MVISERLGPRSHNDIAANSTLETPISLRSGADVAEIRSCLAPATSMRFNPDGMVAVCCVNSRFPVGDIATSTVREIWEGTRSQALEDALAAHDYSLGCQECGRLVEAGERNATFAATFDQYAARSNPRWPRRLEFALSNRCNLMCIQCNGELSSTIRAKRENRPPIPNHYGDEFFGQIKPFLSHADTCVFLGGEPFLQPESTRIWDMLLELDPGQRPKVDVTTNGTIWNAKVERYVRDLSMTVAVSLDGTTADTTESIRVGSQHDRVMVNTKRLRELTWETGGGFGINTCVLRENVHQLLDMLLLGDELDADVEVVLITYPRELSLLLLPHDELRRALADLEEDDDRAHRCLKRNLPRWQRALSVIRLHLDAGAERLVFGRTSEDVRRLLDAERHVLEQRGITPVQFRGLDRIVVEVSDQDWASDLQVRRWLGLPVDAIPSMLGEVIGARASIEVSPLREDLSEVLVTVGTQQLRVVLAKWWSEDSNHMEGLVAEVRQ